MVDEASVFQGKATLADAGSLFAVRDHKEGGAFFVAKFFQEIESVFAATAV